ncbi:MAG: hypothetical protein AUK16_00320 [Parcubacteria group bacterium CG2_30_44_11]|nr:MAG: hypothetical protein AUK16_00320 [Parcubacteria group bacterium CG2_30_44_11]
MWLAPRAMYVTAALVMTPINVVKTWLAESSSSLPQYLRNRSVLIEQMKALEQQIADGGGDHFTAEMLAKENDELRSLLGYVGDERILAGVIGRPSALPYDMLMIDKGERDGIVVGAPAYIGDRTVIGYVQSITSKTALVTLITTPDFVSTVYVLGPDIFTNAVGLGGGQLKVGIPQGIKVKEGDLVILPSINSGVYGSVSYIETVPTQPEQYAYVAPKTAISSLRLISIGTTPMLGTNFDAALKNVEAVRNDLFTVSVPPGYFATTTRVTSTPEAVVDRKVIP